MIPDKPPRERADPALASSFERSLQDKGKGRGAATRTTDETQLANSSGSLNGPSATAVATIPAGGEAHLRANLYVFDIALTGTEMERAAELGGSPLDGLRSLLDR